MSDAGSDDFPEFSFSFTEEDLAKLDATITSVLELEQDHNSCVIDPAVEGTCAPSQTKTIPLEDLEEPPAAANLSFGSDAFDLNLGALSAEELSILDADITSNPTPIRDGPSIEVGIENATSSSSSSICHGISNTPEPPSMPPLVEFRSYMPLSVTDLCSPSWCEVQYDYGLRGRRSRPLTERPKSFMSSSGKIISPAATVAKENEVMTRQGLAVHKELEREIKFEELQVELTTPETRWALRLVNMLACLRGILDGFTREMPVFGIIHDEVVVGIMDEVTKGEVPSTKKPKRPSDPSQTSPSSKRAKTISSASPNSIDRYFGSLEKTIQEASPPEGPSTSRVSVAYTLYIKDNKTRKNEYMPSDADMHSGRIQLMIYRRLLSELVSTNPPYDFRLLWDKMGLDSSQVFPTKFLIQAQLIKESDHFKTSCLDDLVHLWHNLVKESNIVGVDPHLELIYRLRPPRDVKQKNRATETPPATESIPSEDQDLANAIAESLRGSPASNENNTANTAGPSKIWKSISLEKMVETLTDSTDESSNLEDVQLQWALQQSIIPQSDSAMPPASTTLKERTEAFAADLISKARKRRQPKEEAGIRRFKIIGTKRFLYNDRELDLYLSHIFEWWRGERRPEGVSLEHSYRCLTCEYANDCEWRAEKALEHSRRKKK